MAVAVVVAVVVILGALAAGGVFSPKSSGGGTGTTQLVAGTPSANPNPVDSGVSTTISTTAASGGSGGYAYTWSSSLSGCTGGGGQSYSCTPTVSISSPNFYTITLTVTDSNGATAASSFTLTVDPGVPALSVTDSASPYAGSHPLAVSFSSAVTGGTPPYQYFWNLGDGTTATTSTYSDTYTLRGTYTVSLEVTDSAGHSAAASPIQIVVNPVTYTITVEEGTGVSVGAGAGGALVYSFTVPTIGAAPNAIDANIQGTVMITACSFLCGNKLAFVVIATPIEVQNIEAGGQVQVLYCYTGGTSTCQAEQTSQIAFDLSAYSGQVLDLMIYNTNGAFTSQTATVEVTITYSA